MPGRTVGVIKGKIDRMVKSGELENNSNKIDHRAFTRDDINFIKTRRTDLIQSGFNDNAIAQKLAKEMPKRGKESIRRKIDILIKAGELQENPNKREKTYFTKDEIAFIKKRRQQFMEKGLTDNAIAQKLAGEMHQKAMTIGYKIRNMIKSGELNDNPNKVKPGPKRSLSDDQILKQLSEAVDVYTDTERETND